MNTRYVTAALVVFAVVLGWNVFLIQRDQKLYDAYYGPQVTKANEK
jgi:hypothetical protein